MRFSLALAAAALVGLTVVGSADAQFRRGGGRVGISIGIGSGGYGYPGYGGFGYGGYGGYGRGYGYSPFYGGGSGFGLSIGRSSGYGFSPYYGGGGFGYGGYGGYGRSSFYQPGFSVGIGRGYARPYSSWHTGWNPGSWSWANSPSVWTNYNSASVFGTTGTRVYTNPFVSGAPITVGTVNYSNPLPQAPETIPAVSDEATAPFTEARNAFRRGDYKAALGQVDKAIEKAPADSTLSEFRGLCLFAMKDYKAAAQVLHPVLASGPGWTWDTIKALYGDPTTYTGQLRALEDAYLANKDDAAASFLLAYHYLVLDYNDSAKRHLQNVARLTPDDKLAPELLRAMQ